ncbi:MAG: OsmC family protein [Myxococcota bacterium]
MQSTVRLEDGMAFDVDLGGFSFTIDAHEAVGGRGLGPLPKGLTLSSLAGCTAMDVISILRKMKVEVTEFDVSADATMTTEHPKRFDTITLTYRVDGPDPSPKKVLRAVQLSEERYCGVSASLRPTVHIESRVFINGERVEREAVA